MKGLVFTYQFCKTGRKYPNLQNMRSIVQKQGRKRGYSVAHLTSSHGTPVAEHCSSPVVSKSFLPRATPAIKQQMEAEDTTEAYIRKKYNSVVAFTYIVHSKLLISFLPKLRCP